MNRFLDFFFSFLVVSIFVFSFFSPSLVFADTIFTNKNDIVGFEDFDDMDQFEGLFPVSDNGTITHVVLSADFSDASGGNYEGWLTLRKDSAFGDSCFFIYIRNSGGTISSGQYLYTFDLDDLSNNYIYAFNQWYTFPNGYQASWGGGAYICDFTTSNDIYFNAYFNSNGLVSVPIDSNDDIYVEFYDTFSTPDPDPDPPPLLIFDYETKLMTLVSSSTCIQFSDDPISYNCTGSSTYPLPTKDIEFALSIIIVLLFLMVVGFAFNNITNKTPWR